MNEKRINGRVGRPIEGTLKDISYASDYRIVCPECGTPMVLEWWGGYTTLPPLSVTPEFVRQNIFHCRSCGSDWKTVGNSQLERYFFG